MSVIRKRLCVKCAGNLQLQVPIRNDQRHRETPTSTIFLEDRLRSSDIELDTMETSVIFSGNAQVIDNVAQGLYDEAILSAKTTLGLLIPKLQSSNVKVSESESVDSFIAWQDIQLPAWDDEDLSNAGLSICMKTFHMDHLGEISDASLRLVSVTLLYNMALSFHLKGVATADQRFCNLQKALNIYTKTLLVMSERRHELGPRERIVELAINNNMGNIYSYVGCKQQVNFCLDRIRDLMVFFANESDLMQIEHEILHFKLNVYLFESVMPTQHSPAA